MNSVDSESSRQRVHSPKGRGVVILDNAPDDMISLVLFSAERSHARDGSVTHTSSLGNERAKQKRVFPADVCNRGLKRRSGPPDFFKSFPQAARENFSADKSREAGQAVENKSL